MALFSTMFNYFTTFVPGNRMVDGGDCLTLANMFCAVHDSLTALAGGNAALGTQLKPGINVVTVCATDADSVRLPAAVVGLWCVVLNQGAADLQVFGQQANQGGLAAGDAIIDAGQAAAAAVATGVTQADPTPGIYICIRPGVWKQFLCLS